LQVQGDFFIFEDSERWTCTGGCVWWFNQRRSGTRQSLEVSV